MDGREFVWAHFKLNAEQRLRGFNFFVVLAIFADGGVLAALQRGFSPGLLILLGAFTMLLAQVFWLVDARSRQPAAAGADHRGAEGDGSRVSRELPAVRHRCPGAEPGDQLHLRHSRAAAGADGLRPRRAGLWVLPVVTTAGLSSVAVCAEPPNACGGRPVGIDNHREI